MELKRKFFRIAGKKPHSLNIVLARKECQRIGDELKRIYCFPEEKNFAYKAERFYPPL